MLHITNGDSAADLLRAAGLPGEVLPWRDVLHEGPVPANLGPEDLRRVRAEFLAALGWCSFRQAIDEFEERDLKVLSTAGEIVLWFEHDLYDQLQVLQIFDLLARRDDRETLDVRLVLIDDHPAVDRFIGLGQLMPEHIPPLFAQRRMATPHDEEVACSAWHAFRSSDPREITRWLARDSSQLPLLAPALRRHAQQFPGARDGLSRCERQALHAIASGIERFFDLFRHHQEVEESPFLGDAVFAFHLDRLTLGEHPLIRIEESPEATSPVDPRFLLTSAGERVLTEEEDRIRLNGIDRWLGGVRLSGQSCWRWSESEGFHERL